MVEKTLNERRQEYLELSTNNNRLDFLLNELELEEPILMGILEKRQIASGNKLFFITNLIDPKTGNRKFEFLVEGTVFVGSYDFEDISEGDVVQFEFEPSYRNDEDWMKTHVYLGRVLNANPKTIKKVDLSLNTEFDANIVDDVAVVHVNENKGAKVYYADGIHNKLFIDFFNKKEKELIEKEELIQVQLEELDKIKEDTTNKKNKLEIEANLVKKQFSFLRRIGLIDDSFLQTKGNKEVIYDYVKQFSDLTQEDMLQIQTNIYRNSDNIFMYPMDVIKNIIASISTDQLTVLYGSSGTGKTSIIGKLADAIGAKYKVIPVQSSWIDRQDLLGYFNPLSKMYYSTPFLDAIKEAEEDEDTLYLIGLDELNLSQVEYYFADLLSLREQNEPIPLYSRQEYENNIAEINWYIQQNKDLQLNENSIKDNVLNKETFNYNLRLKNMNSFKPDLFIPKNVRFIGTMNIDGTTKPLSPKVIDRAYFIEVEKRNKNESLDNLDAKRLKITTNDLNKNIESIINFNELPITTLKELNVVLNERSKKYMQQVAKIYQQLGIKSDKELIDEIFYSKVLPKVNYFMKSNEDTPNILVSSIGKLVGEKSKSYKKANRMLDSSNNSKVFSYWGD